MIKIQISQHILKRSGRFCHPPLKTLAILQVIQEKPGHELTLAEATRPAVLVHSPSEGRVDLDAEVY